MEREAKLESQLCDFQNTCPQAAVWEEPQLRRTPRLTVSAARTQVAQKTKPDLTTGIHQRPRYTITTFPLPWTPLRGSWSYMPSRHGLQWPDPMLAHSNPLGRLWLFTQGSTSPVEWSELWKPPLGLLKEAIDLMADYFLEMTCWTGFPFSLFKENKDKYNPRIVIQEFHSLSCQNLYHHS